MPKNHRSLKPPSQKIKKIISIKFSVLIAFSCLFIAFTVQAEELFLNEPLFDSPPIESSNPVTPSVLIITDITSSSATLTWTKNNDPDFAYYVVRRATSLVPPTWVSISRIYDQNRISFTDTLPQGATYYYQIITLNQTGQYSWSDILGALYASYADITIDGSVSDWSSFPPSIQDRIGDKQPGSPSGTDISNIYLAYDNQYFYIRIDLADGPPNTQDIVYYVFNLNKQAVEHVIGDRDIVSYFFPGLNQSKSILQERTSIDPHQAITLAIEPAAAGQNTLEMRAPLAQLNGGLLYFYVRSSTTAGPPPIPSYDYTVQIAIKIPRIYPDKAVELAKDVLGAPYLGDGETWGGKGYNCTSTSRKFVSSAEIKNLGYYFYDNRPETRDCSTTTGRGVDCSGLSFWSYNRAYFGDKKIIMGECLAYITVLPKCPMGYDGADGQYKSNTTEVVRGELKSGDLIFFNPSGDKNQRIKHVAMYIGNNEVVEASFTQGKVIRDTLDGLIARLQGVYKLVGFGRVTEPRIDAVLSGKSSGHSIDLIVTDPEGVVITKEIYEAPGLYYREYDLDEDGRLEDFISIPKRKIGDYLVQAVPEPDALPTDTYTLKIDVLVNGVTVTKFLAENALISDIPSVPYILRSTETEIEKIIPAKAKIEPETLNLDQKGVFTAFIEFSKGFGISVTGIDPQTVTIQGISAVRTSIAKDKFIVKFQTQDLVNITSGEKVKFKIAGKLKDGTAFEGIDTIRVIHKGQISGLSSLLANLHETLSQLSKILQMLQ